MSERERQGGERAGKDEVGPAAEESWRRHLDILDLLNQIRETRGRKQTVESPDRSR